MTDQLTQLNLVSFLKGQKLMEGLTQSELSTIVPYLKIVSFEPGSIVFNEDEQSNELYIIFEGEVLLLKNEENRQQQYQIGKIGKGGVFGEMSFLDNSPRSCAIKTNYDLILVQLSHEGLEGTDAHVQSIYGKILQNIAKITIERLRESNKSFAKIRGREIKSLQIHNEFGRFFINTLVTMLAACGVSGLLYLAGYFNNDFFPLVNWAALLFTLLPIYYFVKLHDYPLSKFSLTTSNWKASLGLSVALSLIIAVFFGLGRYAYEKWYGPSLSPQLQSWLYLIAYPLYVYIAEFILRGTMQTSIQKFLPYSPTWVSVFYIAIIAACNNLYFGALTASLVLLLNILCGFVFERGKNLFASSLLHLVAALALKYCGLIPFSNFT